MAAKMERVWDNNIVIGETPMSDRTKLVVAASVRDGYRYINLREFYLKKSTKEWKPSLKGICIPLTVVSKEDNTVLIEAMKNATELIDKALPILETMALYDEANAVYIPKKARK